LGIFFALLAIAVVPELAAAQDMPPILAPPAPAVMATPVPASPSAEAVIPPAMVAPPAATVGKKHVAAADHRLRVRHEAKTAAVKKRLTAAHARTTTHHIVAFRAPERTLPAGMVVPPPGYYAPGPYERLVYGGPPRGLYNGWAGYRGRYPYYP
jgi:hypothetical protein